jgi:hypothetical protein
MAMRGRDFLPVMCLVAPPSVGESGLRPAACGFASLCAQGARGHRLRTASPFGLLLRRFATSRRATKEAPAGRLQGMR